jgi:hypothetical protein
MFLEINRAPKLTLWAAVVANTAGEAGLFARPVIGA